MMQFAERYGPWALIAGASEGTGRSFARKIAAQGVSCILIARDGPLEDLAEEIRKEAGVACISARIDLSAPDAAARIIAVADGREVGLYVANAGADWLGVRFLDGDVDEWMALSRINVDSMVQCAHHFARAMRGRRRGGIFIVNSGACYGGGPFLAMYTAVKAFQLNFAESLWSELKPYGVDVLTIVLGQTDTPAYHRLQAKKHMPPGPNLASPDAVAQAGLAHLHLGPVHNWGMADDDAGGFAVSADERRAKVQFMEQAIEHVFGVQPPPDLG